VKTKLENSIYRYTRREKTRLQHRTRERTFGSQHATSEQSGTIIYLYTCRQQQQQHNQSVTLQFTQQQSHHTALSVNITPLGIVIVTTRTVAECYPTGDHFGARHAFQYRLVTTTAVLNI